MKTMGASEQLLYHMTHIAALHLDLLQQEQQQETTVQQQTTITKQIRIPNVFLLDCHHTNNGSHMRMPNVPLMQQLNMARILLAQS